MEAEKFGAVSCKELKNVDFSENKRCNSTVYNKIVALTVGKRAENSWDSSSSGRIGTGETHSSENAPIAVIEVASPMK